MFKEGVPEIKRTLARSFKKMQGLENEIILKGSVPPATRPVSTKAETQTQARRHGPCKSQKGEVMLGVGVGESLQRVRSWPVSPGNNRHRKRWTIIFQEMKSQVSAGAVLVPEGHLFPRQPPLGGEHGPGVNSPRKTLSRGSRLRVARKRTKQEPQTSQGLREVKKNWVCG